MVLVEVFRQALGLDPYPARKASSDGEGEQPAGGGYCPPDLLKERRSYTEDRPWVDCTVYVLVTKRGKYFADNDKTRLLDRYRSTSCRREDYAIEEIVVQAMKPGTPHELLQPSEELVVYEAERQATPLELGVAQWAETHIQKSATERVSCEHAMTAYNLWAVKHDHETVRDPGAFGRAINPVLSGIGVHSRKIEGKIVYINLELTA